MEDLLTKRLAEIAEEIPKMQKKSQEIKKISPQRKFRSKFPWKFAERSPEEFRGQEGELFHGVSA